MSKYKISILSFLIFIAIPIIATCIFVFVHKLIAIEEIRRQERLKIHKTRHIYSQWEPAFRQPYLYHKCIVCGWIEAKPIPVIRE